MRSGWQNHCVCATRFGLTEALWPAEAITMSKIANISTVIQRHKVTFADTMPSLLSYVSALEEDYGVRVVDVHMKNIVEDMISSNFLEASPRAIYMVSITVSEKMIRHQSVLRLLWQLANDAPAAKTHGLTHIDYRSLYKSSEEDTFLKIQHADPFVENGQMLFAFHTKSFYRISGLFFMSFIFAT